MTEPPTDAMIALLSHYAVRAGLTVRMPVTKLEAIKLIQDLTLSNGDDFEHVRYGC